MTNLKWDFFDDIIDPRRTRETLAAAALAFHLGPARAARWLAGNVAQELQELGAVTRAPEIAARELDVPGA